MANIKKFEDLPVWQDARALTRSMFVSKRKTSDFIIIDVYKQLFRSLGSVTDNIAEGFERKGRKEFIQFLNIAKASAGEARSQVYRLEDFEIYTKEEAAAILEKLNSISKQLNGFIQYLKSSDIQGWRFKEEDPIYELQENLKS
jgi:four helix bundle protein